MFLCVVAFLLIYRVISIHNYYRIGADDGTGGTACTIGVVRLGGEIAVFVGFAGNYNTSAGTKRHTQATALASLHIDDNLAGHFYNTIRDDYFQ